MTVTAGPQSAICSPGPEIRMPASGCPTICEMLNRRINTVIASGSVGISGTMQSRTFDGKCVTNIVLINPIRAARCRR